MIYQLIKLIKAIFQKIYFQKYLFLTLQKRLKQIMTFYFQLVEMEQFLDQ